VLPIDRKGSLDQPMLHLYTNKLSQGNWCHLFPEGRIWQDWRFNTSLEVVLGPWKYGIGKVIAHSYPNPITVLPIYHTGMSNVYPELILNNTSETSRISKKPPSIPRSIQPSVGHKVECYIGEPISFHEKLRIFDKLHPGLLGE
jgi:1-acyl-sn-glycerol-3-phosphate acyltransferase